MKIKATNITAQAAQEIINNLAHDGFITPTTKVFKFELNFQENPRPTFTQPKTPTAQLREDTLEALARLEQADIEA